MDNCARHMHFPCGSVVKKLPAMQEFQEMQLRCLGWEDPLEEGTATHFSTLIWRVPRKSLIPIEQPQFSLVQSLSCVRLCNFHGLHSLADYNP